MRDNFQLLDRDAPGCLADAALAASLSKNCG